MAKQSVQNSIRESGMFPVRLAEATRLLLANEIGDAIPVHQKRIVQAAAESIANRLLGASNEGKQAVTSDPRYTDVWPHLIESREFALSIWGSQRLCFSGIYFGYENFVRACVFLATGKPTSDDWTKGGELLKQLKELFGVEFVDGCIADATVNCARLVRNALVHNGGKLSAELRDLNHGFKVENDVLQIMAPDTSRLFNELKTRAFKLAERAIELPTIKVPLV